MWRAAAGDAPAAGRERDAHEGHQGAAASPANAATRRCPPVQIISAALAARQPTMFFCKLGKDRTGLLAALVLASCGATDDQLVADYTR